MSCGPSNVSRFTKQVDRDRSLVQDRTASGGFNPNESFRGPAAAPSVAQPAYGQFHGGPVSMEAGIPAGIPAIAPIMPHNPDIAAYLHPFQPSATGPMHASPIPIQAKHPAQVWVQQFDQMNFRENPAGPSASTATAPQAGMQPFQGRPYAAATVGYNPYQGPATPITVDWLARQRDQAARDQAEFEQEMYKWTAQHLVDPYQNNQAEFEREMDKWTAANLASFEPDQLSAAVKGKGVALPNNEMSKAPEAAQAADKDAGEAGTDLARVARELVNAVGDDPSEKFQKSNFLDMMRRIAAGQVILKGNDLVDLDQGDISSPKA